MLCRLFPASSLLLFLLSPAFQDRAVAVGPTMFLTDQAFPAGNENRSLVVADLNGDGKLDVVTAAFCSPDSSVNVLLNKGNGNFQAAVNYAVGRCPNSIAVGDFNGDGKLDLVTANRLDNNVSVLLGHGDGTFAAAVNYAVGSGPASVAVGDINGDGHVDLVVANQNDRNVTVLLGNGNGTFQAGGNFSLPKFPTSLVLADFNGDGKLDVAVANSGISSAPQGISYVSVLLGNGDGTFQPAVTYRTTGGGSAFVALAVGDFNGDGKPDLVTANPSTLPGGANVSVLLGNGDGTFQAPKNSIAGAPPQSVAVADFDGDGKLDVVVTDYGTDNISILRGKGDGTFRAPLVYVGGGGAFSVAVGDFNGNRKLDIVTGNLDGSISELLGNGDATFQAAAGFPVTVPNRIGASSVATGDFNGDGQLDLAVPSTAVFPCCAYLGSVSVFLGNKDGTFRAPRNYSVGIGTGREASFVAVGDFNGDGKLDLVAADESNNQIAVLLGNGDGTFKPAVSYPAGSAPYYIAVGDFNRDGKLDLAVANLNGNNVSVLLGNGDGSFPAAVNYSVGTSPLSVAVGDFNGDGKLDLVVANSGETDVSVLLGNGNGTFQAAVNYSTGSSFPQEAVVGDFNGDGKPDLAVAVLDGSVSVFLGNGNGTFQPAVSYPVHSSPGAVAVGDFNHDGKLDLVTVAAISDGLGLSQLLGNGDGTFQAAVNYKSGPLFGNNIAVGDFNDDGAPDLAAVSFDGVEVLLNTRGSKERLTSSKDPSSFGAPVTFMALVQPTVDGSSRVAGNMTGTVTFRDGTTTLGTLTLVPGSVNFTTSSLSRGTHSITATYSGDGNYNPVTSSPLIQTVQ